jgi:hypothetical protein
MHQLCSRIIPTKLRNGELHQLPRWNVPLYHRIHGIVELHKLFCRDVSASWGVGVLCSVLRRAIWSKRWIKAVFIVREWSVLDGRESSYFGVLELCSGAVLDVDRPRDLSVHKVRGGAVLDYDWPCDLGVYKMRQRYVRVYAGIRCVHCNLEADHAPHHWSSRYSTRRSNDESHYATRCVARAHR